MLNEKSAFKCSVYEKSRTKFEDFLNLIFRHMVTLHSSQMFSLDSVIHTVSQVDKKNLILTLFLFLCNFGRLSCYWRFTD